MVKALIIEDEAYTRAALKAHIARLNDSIAIIGECESVQEAVTVTNACQPDLIFLDINLKDGTGFDFLDQIASPSFKIIFITADDSHAIRALKLGALDYLLKPISFEELGIAIEKVMAITETHFNNSLHVSKESFNGTGQRIVLRMQDSFQIIDFKELVYCKSSGGYTTFHLADDRKFTISKPLKAFNGQLPDALFARPHQSYLINIQFVDRFDKNRFLYLTNGVQIPVSVRRKEEIVERLFS